MDRRKWAHVSLSMFQSFCLVSCAVASLMPSRLRIETGSADDFVAVTNSAKTCFKTKAHVHQIRR